MHYGIGTCRKQRRNGRESWERYAAAQTNSMTNISWTNIQKTFTHTQTHLTPNVLNCFKDYTKIVFTFRYMPRVLFNRRPTLQSCCLSYTDDTMPADALAPKVARAQFQKRSTRDRLRYDPVILIVRLHSTNGDHDQLIRSRKYATKQFIANWIMT